MASIFIILALTAMCNCIIYPKQVAQELRNLGNFYQATKSFPEGLSRDESVRGVKISLQKNRKPRSLGGEQLLLRLKNQRETVYLENHFNLFYTGKVGVGSRENLFEFIFDTGSTNVFLNSIYCDDIGCLKGNKYDSDASPTHEDLLEDDYVVFGSGTLTGALGKDTFFIGDIMIPSMKFLEITSQEGVAFESGGFDGIIGLSYPELSLEDTVFDKMIQLGLIDKPMFSFYLDKSGKGSNSHLYFGGYDSQIIEGEISWHNVHEKLFWDIQVTQILVGETDSLLCSPEHPCKMILDSGTSLLTGPSEDIEKLLTLLQSKYVLREGTTSICQNIPNQPTIYFVIEGISYPLKPSDYIISLSADGEIMPQYHKKDTNLIIDCTEVFSNLDYQEPIGPLWILGDVFMSNFYTIFDKGTNRVGIGKLK